MCLLNFAVACCCPLTSGVAGAWWVEEVENRRMMVALYCHPDALYSAWLPPGAAPESDVHRRMTQNWGILKWECLLAKKAGVSFWSILSRCWMTCVQYCSCYCTANLGKKIKRWQSLPKSTGFQKLKAYISEQYLENEELLCSCSMALCLWFPANNCIFFLVSMCAHARVCVSGGGGGGDLD